MRDRSVFNLTSQMEKRRDLRHRMTPEEWVLWKHLRVREMWGMRFCRQYSVGPFVLDFYAPSIQLAIEVDGGQHFTQEAIVYDEERTAYLSGHGVRVIRFTNLEVRRQVDSVLESIRLRIQAFPSLPRRGRGGRSQRS